MNLKSLKEIVDKTDSVVHDWVHDAPNTNDSVCTKIADTNATGWEVVDYSILDVTVVMDANAEVKTIRADIAFTLSGEQDDDKPYFGDCMKCVAHVSITDNRAVFDVTQAEIVI
jgi:hypothetical protein